MRRKLLKEEEENKEQLVLIEKLSKEKLEAR
jgi:hypothetical protein